MRPYFITFKDSSEVFEVKTINILLQLWLREFATVLFLHTNLPELIIIHPDWKINLISKFN